MLIVGDQASVQTRRQVYFREKCIVRRFSQAIIGVSHVVTFLLEARSNVRPPSSTWFSCGGCPAEARATNDAVSSRGGIPITISGFFEVVVEPPSPRER